MLKKRIFPIGTICGSAIVEQTWFNSERERKPFSKLEINWEDFLEGIICKDDVELSSDRGIHTLTILSGWPDHLSMWKGTVLAFGGWILKAGLGCMNNFSWSKYFFER